MGELVALLLAYMFGREKKKSNGSPPLSWGVPPSAWQTPPKANPPGGTSDPWRKGGPLNPSRLDLSNKYGPPGPGVPGGPPLNIPPGLSFQFTPPGTVPLNTPPPHIGPPVTTMPPVGPPSSPPAGGPPVATPPAPRTYVTKRGDLGSTIARDFTGDGNRWRELRDANPWTAHPTYGMAFNPGSVLTIPASWPVPGSVTPKSGGGATPGGGFGAIDPTDQNVPVSGWHVSGGVLFPGEWNWWA